MCNYSLPLNFTFQVLFLYLQKTSSTNLSPGEEEEEDAGENSCGPTGLWEALTPCNGCRNLGFPILTQVSVYLSTLKYPAHTSKYVETIIFPMFSLDKIITLKNEKLKQYTEKGDVIYNRYISYTIDIVQKLLNDSIVKKPEKYQVISTKVVQRISVT